VFHGLPVVTPRFVSAAHARGVQVHVWTIDEEEEMTNLLDIGVDGLMTDRPSVLKRLLERRGQWPSSEVRG
jgi:glycerophosphoryl diester phosphodiesterase